VKPNSKYYPLYQYLSRSGQETCTLSLGEVERILGQALPHSARNRRGWWSNRKDALPAQAWMSAGYVVEGIDLDKETITFSKPIHKYEIRRQGDLILWDGDLVKALRAYMGVSQSQFADHLGVRQQTVSEWETGVYTPSRATCKYLTLVAEQAGFQYGEET
jgi:DNA-binding transcriptional regulator YiaG